MFLKNKTFQKHFYSGALLWMAIQGIAQGLISERNGHRVFGALFLLLGIAAIALRELKSYLEDMEESEEDVSD